MSDNPLYDRIIHYLQICGPMSGTVIADAMQPYARMWLTQAILWEAVLCGRLVLTPDLKLSLPR